ncbi:MAG: hypothetical protein E7195_00375 [Peptococcaceae bacterium]|nr:hypothetical protein [Peptococcaceae bacterium]
MYKVQLLGIVRLKTGVASLELDEKQVTTLHDLKGMLPRISRKEADDLLVLINGGKAKKHYRFKNGDTVVFLSPAGGG